MAIKDIKTWDPTLTGDDIKVLKHLKSIDNLFKNGDLTISGLFANNGTMCVMKEYDNEDYEIESFSNITCDGGDPDNHGMFGIHSQTDWMNVMEEKYSNV